MNIDDSDEIKTPRNDISTAPSPGAGESDNLGAEDNKGNPPTVPPTGSSDDDESDVEAQDPAEKS